MRGDRNPLLQLHHERNIGEVKQQRAENRRGRVGSRSGPSVCVGGYRVTYSGQRNRRESSGSDAASELDRLKDTRPRLFPWRPFSISNFPRQLQKKKVFLPSGTDVFRETCFKTHCGTKESCDFVLHHAQIARFVFEPTISLHVR